MSDWRLLCALDSSSSAFADSAWVSATAFHVVVESMNIRPSEMSKYQCWGNICENSPGIRKCLPILLTPTCSSSSLELWSEAEESVSISEPGASRIGRLPESRLRGITQR